MSLKICIAIPLLTNNKAQISTLIKDACAKKPEYLEIRFDYLDDLGVITEDFLEFLKTLNQEIPYIFTFRHPSEGGKSDVNTENQLDIIHNLIKSRPHFIDIELNKDSKYFREIIPIAMEFQVNLIFSYHEFYQTPPTEELKKVVDKFEKTVIKELEQDNQDWMYIYKVIPTAHTFTDNIIPLELCKMLSQEDKNIVSFCMGETGIFSRVLSPKAGSFFTYASIGEKTAPGQVHIDVVRKLWDIIE